MFAFEPTIHNKTDIIAFTAQGIEANLTTAGPVFRLPLARALTQEANPRVKSYAVCTHPSTLGARWF